MSGFLGDIQDQCSDLLLETFTPIIKTLASSREAIPDLNDFILDSLPKGEYAADWEFVRWIVKFILKSHNYKNTNDEEWTFLERGNETYYKEEYFRLKAEGLITLRD